MLQGIDFNQVKQYNASLKQYKDKAAHLNAEIEITNKEIDALCAELTAELGIQVTRDNIQQIYDEQVAKINSTLQSGNAVLAKIASEEQAASVASQMATSAPVAPAIGVTAPVPPVPPATPDANPSVAGSVFGTAQPATGTLPAFFSMGN